MTEPTDAEIIALADETRTAEGGANGYVLPISFARAVLAKWGTPQAVAGEPKRVFIVATGEEHEGEATYTRYDASPPPLCDSECLYTTPQPTQAQAGAEPLTDEQIHAIYDKVARREPYAGAVTRRSIVRAIEAAHGIKGGQHAE